MKKFLNLFNFRGKAGRLEFLFVIVINVISQLLLIMIIRVGSFSVFNTLILFIFTWFSLSVTIKRLRDIGQKSWTFIFLFLPLISWLFLIMLLFNKGVEAYTEISTSGKHCGHCGTNIRTGASFCSSCGGKLSVDKINQSLF